MFLAKDLFDLISRKKMRIRNCYDEEGLQVLSCIDRFMVGLKERKIGKDKNCSAQMFQCFIWSHSNDSLCCIRNSVKKDVDGKIIPLIKNTPELILYSKE